MDVVDDLLVSEEKDKHQGDEAGADKNDGCDPGLDIKRYI
jgi:hypothetical protein